MTRSATAHPIAVPSTPPMPAERSRQALSRQAPREHRLATYSDPAGRRREVFTRAGTAGSVLLLDRDLTTRGDRRLVAHLAADEPAENAELVCRDYLRDAAMEHRRCRLVTRDDARILPHGCPLDLQSGTGSDPDHSEVIDPSGRCYRLERIAARMSIPELRWCRRETVADVQFQPVSLRDVIASVESYEPMRSCTLAAVSPARGEQAVSSTTLRAELSRVLESPIVLNRGLRAAVLASVGRGESSMSEIAIRCGRIKRDGRGNVSGETSWLARRAGLLPEGGHDTPTPWIHIDVLALIARDGLGIGPREVEL